LALLIGFTVFSSIFQRRGRCTIEEESQLLKWRQVMPWSLKGWASVVAFSDLSVLSRQLNLPIMSCSCSALNLSYQLPPMNNGPCGSIMITAQFISVFEAYLAQLRSAPTLNPNGSSIQPAYLRPTDVHILALYVRHKCQIHVCIESRVYVVVRRRLRFLASKPASCLRTSG
jgi:hypothetical protein